jgi:hypothetical protein
MFGWFKGFLRKKTDPERERLKWVKRGLKSSKIISKSQEIGEKYIEADLASKDSDNAVKFQQAAKLAAEARQIDANTCSKKNEDFEQFEENLQKVKNENDPIIQRLLMAKLLASNPELKQELEYCNSRIEHFRDMGGGFEFVEKDHEKENLILGKYSFNITRHTDKVSYTTLADGSKLEISFPTDSLPDHSAMLSKLSETFKSIELKKENLEILTKKFDGLIDFALDENQGDKSQS